MHIKSFNQPIQDFVRAISCEKSNDIDMTNADDQEQALDYLIQLMQYCVRFDQKKPSFLPEFH